MKIYLVGGAVRDELLGLVPKDRDYVVVGATPADMLARGYRPVGASFPVFLHPKTGEEYALARTERSTGAGHKDFEVRYDPTVTLEDDLGRRDLTINAMAKDLDTDEVIDPFGGRGDLLAQQLRATGPAFEEDPLRILRVARFAAKLPGEFAPTFETEFLCRSMVQRGMLAALPAERIWGELQAGLGSARPDRYIKVLHQLWALGCILPVVAHLEGVPQPAAHHPEVDTFVHVCMALEQAAKVRPYDARVAFAVLMHDAGKGVTPHAEWPKHHKHEETGAALVEQVCARLKAPTEYTVAAVDAARWHTHVHRAFELRPGSIVDLFDALRVRHQQDRLGDLLSAAEADARGRKDFEDREYRQPEYLLECAVKYAMQRATIHGPEAKQQLRDAQCRAVAEVKLQWEV